MGVITKYHEAKDTWKQLRQ